MKCLKSLVLIVLLMLAIVFPSMAEITEEQVIFESEYHSDQGVDNDALLDAYVSRMFSRQVLRSVRSLGTRLTGRDAIVYSAMKSWAVDVAAGNVTSSIFTLSLDALNQATWTKEELGVEAIVVNGALTQEAKDAVVEQYSFNFQTVMRALMNDSPYELYWYDKVTGAQASASYTYSASTRGGEWFLTVSGEKIITMAVAQEYAGEGDHTVDASKAQAAAAAVANASDILSEYASASDESKLSGYRQAICERVSYNHDAVENESTAYGNPWQLIWVFDGDSSTNVVCEGYSKAFQYLCDQTSFSGNVTCNTVTGMMSGGTGEGSHMWNIVSLTNGKNYMVDMTNCDSGSIGANDLLFMKRADSGTYIEGYTFYCRETAINYTYDENTLGVFEPEELILSDNEVVYSGRCGANVQWTLENGVLSIYGEGDMADYEAETDVPWYASQDSIVKVVIDNGVTGIGDYAFSGCTGLTVISIPDSVTSIGVYAFANCNDLVIYASAASWTAGWTRDNDIPLAYTDAGTDGLQYVLSDDGESYIVSGYSGSDMEVTIPYFHNGLPVTAIQNRAFSFNYIIRSILLPDSLNEIGSSAFDTCGNLRSVTLPNSITILNYHTFANCHSLESIVLPRRLQSIGANVFSSCPALETITIPDGCVSIGDEAFSNCRSLSSIALPASLSELGTKAFDGCTALARIDVEEGNNNYTSVDGVLYKDGGRILFRCPPATTMEALVVPEGVTSIAYRALDGCVNLKSISLPASLTEIANGAFGLDNLEAINIADGNPVFSSVDGVLFGNDGKELLLFPAGKTSVVYQIPSGVTSIAEKALQSADIQHLVMPETVLTLGIYACQYAKFEEVTLSSALTTISDWAFDHCENLSSITLPAGVVRIGQAAFQCCYHLSEVLIPDSVNEIWPWAFNQCSSLVSVVLPDGLECVDNSVFRSCTSLEQIVLPDSITALGPNAFDGCKSLQEIDIPTGVTIIHQYAFDGCSALTTIQLPDGLSTISEGLFKNCKKLESVTIPASIGSIQGWAFAYCSSLSEVNLPNITGTIPYRAFYRCTGLEQITIPNGITSIGESAFEGCSGLESVTLPEGLTSIGNYAFQSCGSLTSLAIHANVTNISTGAFSGCPIECIFADPETYAKSWGDDNGYTVYCIHHASSEEDPAVEPTCTEPGCIIITAWRRT